MPSAFTPSFGRTRAFLPRSPGLGLPVTSNPYVTNYAAQGSAPTLIAKTWADANNAIAFDKAQQADVDRFLANMAAGQTTTSSGTGPTVQSSIGPINLLKLS